MHRTIAASALLVAALAWANVTHAEGALAVGIPEGNPAKGFKWDSRVNTLDAASKVMDDCHAARNPRTGAACKLIGTFSDQCVAVTSNGEPTAPVTAAGWAIAADPATATKRAMARCEAMRKGRGAACRLDGENSLLCDGNASALTRGNAWKAKGDLDRAIAEYTEAIRLDPKNARAYDNRGDVYKAKGDRDRAIADYTEAIRIDPKNFNAYFSRGRANLYAGALPKALADLNQASELNPKYAYTALWLDVVNKRSNLPGRLEQATGQIDMTKWPAPVIRLFLGQLTSEAVLAAADNPDPDSKKGQVCEANVYTGELDLQQGKKDAAIALFRAAAADCPKNFIEYETALAELKALGAGP